MKMRKVLSSVLAAAMVLSMVPATALAAEGDTSSLETGSSYTQYSDQMTGAGTQEDPYTISNLAQLKAFRDSVNSGNTYAGKYIELTADIDLGSNEWTPIGDRLGYAEYHHFDGTFDGKNHTISGLQITQVPESSDYTYSAYGLFGAAGANAVFQNLTIDSPNIALDQAKNIGTLLGGVSYAANGGVVTIANVHVTNADLTGNARVGGIVGWVLDSTRGINLSDCSVTGSIAAKYNTTKNDDGDKAGGIVGQISSASSITDSTFSGSVSAYREAAGIVGTYAGGDQTLTGCTVSNTTITQDKDSATASEPRCGKLIGRLEAANGKTFVISLGGNDFSENVTLNADKTDRDGIGAQTGSGTSTVKKKVAQIGNTYYDTLTNAIAAAGTNGVGTTIILAPGTYNGVITFGGKSLTIKAQYPAYKGGVKESDSAKLTNFTGTFNTSEGTGVSNFNEDQKIVIEGLALSGDGLKIGNTHYSTVGTLEVRNCTMEFGQNLTSEGESRYQLNYFVKNSSVGNATVVVEDNYIFGTPVTNVYPLQLWGVQSATVRDNVFELTNASSHQAIGVSKLATDATVEITGNKINGAGGGIYVTTWLLGGESKNATAVFNGTITVKDNALRCAESTEMKPIFLGYETVQPVQPPYGLLAGTQIVTSNTNNGQAVDAVIVRGPAESTTIITATFKDSDTVVSSISGKPTGESSSIIVTMPAALEKDGYTFKGWNDGSTTHQAGAQVTISADTTFTAQWTQNTSTGGGSSSSGNSSSSESSGNKTETTTNPDGSTTTTVTKPNGTVTETTKYPDGSQEVVDTKKDGTVTTTTTDKTGNKTETVENPDGSSKTTVDNKDGSASTTTVSKNGQVEAQVKLPAAVVNEAADKGEAVALPMPEVPVTSRRADAPTVTVDLPINTSAKVEIPVDDVTPGTVAVLVKANGTEEVIKTSLTTENGVAVTLSDGDTVKIVDNSKEFSDVPNSYWGSDYIEFATSRELFAGTGATTFSPEMVMTRAMIVTVLAAYDGVDTTSDGGNWYDAGQRWAMLNGVSDGTNMNASLNREQLAVMLWSYAGKPAPTGDLSRFADADSTSDWAAEAMAWAVENGLISGVGGNTLNPQGLATRAQVATIMSQFVALTA